jgi:hypothetical protein
MDVLFVRPAPLLGTGRDMKMIKEFSLGKDEI